MSRSSALTEADQELLKFLVEIESRLRPRLSVADLVEFANPLARLAALAPRSSHQALRIRALNLLAVLSPRPKFPDQMDGVTSRDAAFLVPLAAAAHHGHAVSGPAAGVWAGAKRPAMPPAAWSHAERELKDLVALTAKRVVPTARPGPLRVPYRPLSRSVSLEAITRVDLPAVAVDPVPIEVRDAAEAAVVKLESYARTLENFDHVDFAMRLARLPEQLFDLWLLRDEGRDLEQRVGQLRERRTLPMQELLGIVLPTIDDPNHGHILLVSDLLQRFNVGFEPDPRFMAALAKPDTTVTIFEWRVPRERPSASFVTAAAVLHIGFAMAGADGSVDALEIEHLRERVNQTAAHDDERTRLALRLEALIADPPDFDRMLHGLKGINPTTKDVVAELLVGVATTDGEVSAPEYDALLRAYRSMRLGKPALDRVLEELRGEVRLTGAIGADGDRRSEVGQERDAKKFDALHELLTGAPPP